jgi:hypothetical protein
MVSLGQGIGCDSCNTYIIHQEQTILALCYGTWIELHQQGVLVGLLGNEWSISCLSNTLTMPRTQGTKATPLVYVFLPQTLATLCFWQAISPQAPTNLGYCRLDHPACSFWERTAMREMQPPASKHKRKAIPKPYSTLLAWNFWGTPELWSTYCIPGRFS